MARLRRVCSDPSCGKLVPCPDHAQGAHRELDRSIIHTARWRRFSKLFLRAHPFCMDHLEKGEYVPSQETHHPIPRREGGGKFDEEECRALCRPCHITRTRAGE